MLKKERNREHQNVLQFSYSAKLDTKSNLFTPETFPLCKDDQCNFSSTHKGHPRGNGHIEGAGRLMEVEIIEKPRSGR